MSSSGQFTLPKDGSTYAEGVFKRCRDFVSFDVWSGIELWKLDAWISNFRTPEENYFAACVLDLLIYRSADQTTALMKQLFQRVIPDLARDNNLPQSLINISKTVKLDLVDPKFRIVPVLTPGDPPSKSGPTLTRMLTRNLDFSNSWTVFPQDLNASIGPDVESIIFIDDFLGTGEQFDGFLVQSGLAGLPSQYCCIYAPLVAHEEGLDSLLSAHPQVHVQPVELLGCAHALFDPASGVFPDGVNSPEIARTFYYDLLEDRGIHVIGPDRRGFGHLEIAFAFENAVPDNTLPILWWNESNDWQRLFNR